MAVREVLNLKNILTPDGIATDIASMHQTWKSLRAPWEAEKAELRNYLFATDTSTTSNATLPWKNSTTLPKLTQIRDNLHANYMAALFPHEDWFIWMPADVDSSDKEKSTAITSYIKNKLIQSDFRTTVSKLILDYIDYGNVFGEVIFLDQSHTLPDGTIEPIYIGPKLKRISPYDIVFDIRAASFKESNKITRSIVTMGALKKMIDEQAGTAWAVEALKKAREVRTQIKQLGGPDRFKSEGFQMDGFGSLYAYYTSGFAEILEFEGDYYDTEKDILYKNHRVIILDRTLVLLNEPYESWLGGSNKEHVGWRERPDNIMAMGPLDNLVGMQYRMDHLENLKADVFDQIAHPPVYQRGNVEDWEWGPGERIFGDEDSDVTILSPDTTALNADFQIPALQQQMEEFAGAPRQAMGVRTPGEKTAFEVQSLENASGRIFQNKVTYFEEVFLEPILNQMLEAGRRNLRPGDLVRVMDNDVGTVNFLKITQEDITAKGKLIPMGARHFARQNQLVANLTSFVQSPAYADPLVNVHVSGIGIARAFETLLGFEKFGIVQKNVRVGEATETSKLTQVGQRGIANDAAIDPEIDILEQEEADLNAV